MWKFVYKKMHVFFIYLRKLQKKMVSEIIYFKYTAVIRLNLAYGALVS